MKVFDVVVIGGGSGLSIMSEAAARGLKVAIVEEGPLGGTCLNRGCIPSKLLIHSGDVAKTIAESEKFGITAKITKVDFKRIVSRVSKIVDDDAKGIERAIRANKKITLYKTRGVFTGKNTLKVGKETIKGKKFFIMAGTRTFVPPIKGIDTVPYMTSTEALRLTKQPKHLVIIGGGFIACELAHFYGSLGTKITIIQRNDVLLPPADRELAEDFTKIYSKRFNIILNATASEVKKKGKNIVVTASIGKRKKIITGDALLVAAGRRPNSDTLQVEKTGVKVNKFGYINTNAYMQTSAPNVWAGGDIAGKYLFKHSANVEAEHMFYNGVLGLKMKPDYYPMPASVFSSPQLASVGAREEDLKPNTYNVGYYRYRDAAMGEAMQDDDGYVKIIVSKKGKILGCHILGEQASTLIHEVVIAMKYNGGKVENITRAIHVHPALSEVVKRAAGSVHHH